MNEYIKLILQVAVMQKILREPRNCRKNFSLWRTDVFEKPNMAQVPQAPSKSLKLWTTCQPPKNLLLEVLCTNCSVRLGFHLLSLTKSHVSPSFSLGTYSPPPWCELPAKAEEYRRYCGWGCRPQSTRVGEPCIWEHDDDFLVWHRTKFGARKRTEATKIFYQAKKRL